MGLEDRIERVFEGTRHRTIPRICGLTKDGVRTAAVSVVHGDPLVASVQNGGIEQVCVDYDEKHFVVHPLAARPLSDELKAYLSERFGSVPIENGNAVYWDREHGYSP